MCCHKTRFSSGVLLSFPLACAGLCLQVIFPHMLAQRTAAGREILSTGTSSCWCLIAAQPLAFAPIYLCSLQTPYGEGLFRLEGHLHFITTLFIFIFSPFSSRFTVSCHTQFADVHTSFCRGHEVGVRLILLQLKEFHCLNLEPEVICAFLLLLVGCTPGSHRLVSANTSELSSVAVCSNR